MSTLKQFDKWLCRYKEGGAESLKDRGGRGRKNILTDEQEQRFKSAVLELQEQREGGRVVGRDIKEMLSKEFGIDCVNSNQFIDYFIKLAFHGSPVEHVTLRVIQKHRKRLKKNSKMSTAKDTGKCRSKKC